MFIPWTIIVFNIIPLNEHCPSGKVNVAADPRPTRVTPREGPQPSAGPDPPRPVTSHLSLKQTARGDGIPFWKERWCQRRERSGSTPLSACRRPQGRSGRGLQLKQVADSRDSPLPDARGEKHSYRMILIAFLIFCNTMCGSCTTCFGTRVS